MQTPLPDDLALRRRVTIGTSVAFLIFVLAMLTALGGWKFVAFAVWACAFVALVILPFYRLSLEMPAYNEGLPDNDRRPGSGFWVVRLAGGFVRWIVLLLSGYPLRHPSGHHGWLKEAAFVAACFIGALMAWGLWKHH